MLWRSPTVVATWWQAWGRNIGWEGGGRTGMLRTELQFYHCTRMYEYLIKPHSSTCLVSNPGLPALAKIKTAYFCRNKRKVVYFHKCGEGLGSRLQHVNLMQVSNHLQYLDIARLVHKKGNKNIS